MAPLAARVLAGLADLGRTSSALNSSGLIESWVKRFELRLIDGVVEMVIQPSTSLKDTRLPPLLKSLAEHLTGYPIRMQVVGPEVEPQRVFERSVPATQLTSKKPVEKPQRLHSVSSKTNDALISDAVRTLPLEVELLRSLHYRIPLISGNLDFLVLSVNTPEHKQQALSRWKDQFEDTHSVLIFLDHARVYSGIRNYLEVWSRGEDLVTDMHRVSVLRSIERMFGQPPTLQNAPAIDPTLEDLTALRCFAVDAPGTKSREDLLHAERLDSGVVRVRVAIIDATDLAPPGSYPDQYAQKIGSSIFGSHMEIPSLGSEIAHGWGSFLEGEVRAAWVFTFDVHPDGVMRRHQVFRANVKNHLNVSPEELSTNTLIEIQLLREATARLATAKGHSNSPIELIESENEGARIVARWMLNAKILLAAQMESATYRNHAIPTPHMKEVLAKKVRDLGIPADAKSFDDRLHFAGILQALGQRQAREVQNQILSVFLTKTTFSTENHGHYGLRLTDGYLDIKPRDATGLTNQQTLRAQIDPAYPVLTEADRKKRARDRNRQLHARPSLEYRLRFFEQLAERLAWVGSDFTGTVQERGQNFVLVEFPEFTKWGIIRCSDPASIPDGVTARLLGFSRSGMRFEFTLQQS